MMYILSVLVLILVILLIVKIRRGLVEDELQEHKTVDTDKGPIIYYEGLKVSEAEFQFICEGEYDVLDVSTFDVDGAQNYIRGPRRDGNLAKTEDNV